MLSLRVLLFLTFIGNSFLQFHCTATFSFPEPNHGKSAAIDFYEDYSTLINLPELITESFLFDYNVPKPKVVYGSKQEKNSFSSTERVNAGLLYLKYSKMVHLKLASFLISFPFHSFP